MPAVIIPRQSRQARRNSWRGEPGSRRRGAHHAAAGVRYQREEDVLEAAAAAGAEAELGERALGDQTAAGQHADALGHALGDLEDVGGHDDGAAGADARLEHVLDLPRGAGVEAGQRLVEDDQARVVDQRAGQRHLLAHAAREALAALVGVRSEAQPVDQLGGGRGGLGPIDAPQAGDEFEILERRQLVVDHRLVGEPRHQPLGGDRIGQRVDAVDRDRAGVRLQQPDHHAERGGLAGAVGPEERIELAGAHRQVETIDGRAVERLGERAERQGGAVEGS